MDFAKIFLGLQVHWFAMYTMNQPKFHIDANQMVPTSQANKIEFVGPPTVIKCRPHILRLHVPTSIQNVMLSFEPNSQGPVTIEISLTTMSPELGNDTFHATQACVVDFGANIGTGGVKLGSADAHVSAVSDPLLVNIEPLPAMQGSFGCIPDHLLPADKGQTNTEGGTALPIAPLIPAVDNSETEPESVEGTPTVAVKKTTSEIPVSSLPAQVSGPSIRRTFTPDSFAGSETFDTVSTQLLCERWAQIREGLIAGQENNKRCRVPLLSEASTPTPPTKCFRK
ncbi:hypothetical protein BKA82DRAFT_995026 [Pisolithus tinctorius]|uniref:Uncharacterized protein n=1 Tax=Pisolithus tinctorius Marx 270 TaxID=870435 RepID=A0A0C3KP81_PISTI|nr:hypothetical protein BKA82DRAFT_995026 [Pisolithus tinctorius]KIO11367.1 hypothetical protein M404DRAFT_995026 [Pisolithus tinctorius Marx 270]